MADYPDFLYPRCDYLGNYSPANLVFITALKNLKVFLERVNYICDLRITGELSLEDACQQIYEVWENYHGDIQIVLEKDRLPPSFLTFEAFLKADWKFTQEL